jgi:multidrug efflux pump subunit AcrA (membrane-fusion protein)
MNRTQKWVVSGVTVGLAVVLAGVVAHIKANATNAEVGVSQDRATSAQIVCVGRIEPVDGEADVSAQMAGTLEAVLVKEGQQVDAGQVLAVVDARREKAQLELAKANLARIQAGHGAEEIDAVAAQRDAAIAELTLAESELVRARKLKTEDVIADDLLETRQQQADSAAKHVASLQKLFEAMKRGPLPEEVAVAREEVGAAKANYDLHEVRAPFAGTVLQLYRHTGDGVLVNYPTPILRMADMQRLRVRIEVSEQDIGRVKPGMKGEFTVFGSNQSNGQLVIKTILPSFAPRRLFDPDSSARVDTRTVQVLCEIVGGVPGYSGQRLTARFTTSSP